jgi:hypothetical protein
VSRARSSSRPRPRRRTARPAHHQVQHRRLRPDHRRHGSHSEHHRASTGHDPPHALVLSPLATGVADGDGVGLDQFHARGAGSVSAARRHDAHPIRQRAQCHRAQQRVRGLIAATLPGCTPACTHPCM